MKDIADIFGDLPDFPGKTPPKNRAEGNRRISSSFDIFEGIPKKLLSVNGEKKEFYTIGSLAQIVGRTPLAVRKWERKGWIPAPTYRSTKPSGHSSVNHKNKGYRLYSREQVELIYQSLDMNGLIGIRNTGWREPHRWLSFIEHVRENWPK